MSRRCTRPECGGEQHTDPWGTPVQCPHVEPVVQADTGRRCPRCDCPDGHEQCQHCKVCPHADGGHGGSTSLAVDGTASWVLLAPAAPPCIEIMGEDQTPLVTIHPSGTLDYGPGYTPDAAARAFWDALRHLAPARCPNCGHIGLESP